MRNGARIINMALTGSNPSEEERVGLADISASGVLIVAAAGNYGRTDKNRTYYPAGYESTLSVSAVGATYVVSRFSNANAMVDICAPGENILSTFPDGAYYILSGTTPATAHVVGVAALLWSWKPTATVDEIKAALLNSALDLGPPGRDDSYGHGLSLIHI